ncbi:MAG: bacteriohopanetetrol glucosamine biosynthesis glycosyltransferase HpnI [Bryobacteraceae bacterium]
MILLAALAAAGGVYYLLALAAALAWRRAAPPAAEFPPVSILKPLHGRDPHFLEAIRSHAAQDYPEFEILFALRDGDPAGEDVRRLMAEFPRRAIRIVPRRREAPNGKAAAMVELAAAARYPVLLVNDSDIRVPPDYLRRVAAKLGEPGVGLATCLYRAAADSAPARWEALAVATEFAPSVLVARMLGVVEFALGSTMALRAADLKRAGGFEALEQYLADDYQLGKRVTALGLRVAFAPAVVETHLGAETWAAAWRHQLRWSRTVRVSRRFGYFGYAVTHATFWSLAAMAAGWWPVGAAALALRMLAGVVTAGRVLGDRGSLVHFYLVPLRDLWGFALWCAGLFGRTVDWRGQKLRLDGSGRIR